MFYFELLLNEPEKSKLREMDRSMEDMSGFKQFRFQSCRDEFIKIHSIPPMYMYILTCKLFEQELEMKNIGKDSILSFYFSILLYSKNILI